MDNATNNYPIYVPDTSSVGAFDYRHFRIFFVDFTAL